MSDLHIQIIVSSITAIAAIVAPVITAIVTSCYNLKMRKLELFETAMHPAVSEFTTRYVEMKNAETNPYIYWAFVSSAYRLIGLIDNKKIQQQIIDLITEVRNARGHTSQNTDSAMDELMVELAKCQLSGKSSR